MNPELYTAAQGLSANNRQLEVIANNLANANTTGFRSQSTFYHTLNTTLALKDSPPVNALNHSVNSQPLVGGVYTQQNSGPIKATGNQLDFAIEGDGYFAVQTPNGVRFTRAGHFFVDANTNELTTPDGYRVLSEGNQPVVIPMNEEVLVDNNGKVYENGAEVGSIGVFTFADPSVLRPEGNNLLEAAGDANAAANAQPEARPKILQGYLEQSNVNVAKQMVEMIMAQRAYEANTRSIRSVDRELNQQVIQAFSPRG